MIIYKGKDYLTKQEFADAVDASYNAITNWIAKGWIEPAYVSEKGRHFFTQEQVDNYWKGMYMPVVKRDVD